MLSRWLELRAARILAHEPSSDSIGFEVRQWLSTRVAGGDTRITLIARQLGVTPRTLQRRLAAEGTTYDDLRDEARKQAAETFLADPALSIAEIAYLLGYAEPTAFHRAFRRWHQMTPQAFRDGRDGRGTVA
jgi:AraC-like DNA-binding protein